MDDIDTRNGEQAIDASGRNRTQQRLDAEGTDDVPVDAGWEETPVERDDAAVSLEDAQGGTGPDDGGPGSDNM